MQKCLRYDLGFKNYDLPTAVFHCQAMDWSARALARGLGLAARLSALLSVLGPWPAQTTGAVQPPLLCQPGGEAVTSGDHVHRC